MEIEANAVVMNVPTLCTPALVRRYGQAFTKVINLFAGKKNLAEAACRRLEASAWREEIGKVESATAKHNSRTVARSESYEAISSQNADFAT